MRYNHQLQQLQIGGGMQQPTEYFHQQQHHDYMKQMQQPYQQQQYGEQQHYQHNHEEEHAEESASPLFDTDEPIEAGSFGTRIARKSHSDHDHEYVRKVDSHLCFPEQHWGEGNLFQVSIFLVLFHLSIHSRVGKACLSSLIKGLRDLIIEVYVMLFVFLCRTRITARLVTRPTVD